MQSSAAVAAEYFAAWKARDPARFRAVLADNVTFNSPRGSTDGIDGCMAVFDAMLPAVADVDVRRQWVDGGDVITWFDVRRHNGSVTPAANWSHVEHGLVTGVRVTFDLLAGNP